jgi:NADH-quinone oxidoreductase subunit G
MAQGHPQAGTAGPTARFAPRADRRYHLPRLASRVFQVEPMPTLTIDGQKYAFDGKKMILQVALDNGYEIPHYCYHPGLSIVASCRICLAEVAQPNPKTGKLDLIPKLMPTCQTPAADGMVVHTQSPKAIANQKAVMEYLLINHPLDCPVCDQAGECSLQDYSFEYGRAASRFQEEKIKQPVKDIGPNVKLYSDRCIMCSRCVRFTREVSGTGEIGIFGRGSHEQIDVFPGKPLANELSANVVDICPVGALLDKDFLFTQRVWFLKQTPSIDGITASGDNISIHHNEGRIYRVKPRKNMDVNKWWISDEIRYGWKFVHSEERLSQPLRKQLGEQINCDWQRGYEEVRDSLREVIGTTAIAARPSPGGGGTPPTSPTLAVIVSPMLTCEEAYLLGRLARTLDPKAMLILGPIPRQGSDKTFPGGYTVYAEKCPNSRGVRRALLRAALLHGDGSGDTAVHDYDEGLTMLADKKSTIAAAVITGNFPSAWTTKELTDAVKGKFTVVIDTLPNDLTARADVLLPGATWAEKAGTFENARGRLQSFRQAIAVREGCRTEGQIALDLLAVCAGQPRRLFDDAAVRAEMGDAFVANVHHPVEHQEAAADMEYVEL